MTMTATKPKQVDTTNARLDIETWLNDRAVLFEFLPGTLISDFDIKASQSNQARFVALSHDWSESYAEAIERGELFPPIIATRNEKGKLVVIDGNHRLIGHKLAGRDAIDTYEVVAPVELLHRLMVESNSRNGHRFSHEESIIHACRLVDAGVTRKAAAAMLGLTESVVLSEYARLTVDRRASRLQIPGWKSVPTPAKRRLANVRSDNVLKEASKLVAATKAKTVEVDRMVSEINRRSTEGAQLEFIQAERERLAQVLADTMAGAKRKGLKQTPRMSLLMHSAALENINAAALVNSCLNAKQRDEVITKVEKLRTLCDQIEEALSGSSVAA